MFTAMPIAHFLKISFYKPTNESDNKNENFNPTRIQTEFLLLIPTSFVCGRLVHLKRFERQHKVNKSLNYIWCMNNV